MAVQNDSKLGATLLLLTILDSPGIVQPERYIMDKYEKQKINIEQLPNDFSMSDKQTLTLIRDLFEMIKDGNKIIHLLDNRIKLLELKLKN